MKRLFEYPEVIAAIIAVIGTFLVGIILSYLEGRVGFTTVVTVLAALLLAFLLFLLYRRTGPRATVSAAAVMLVLGFLVFLVMRGVWSRPNPITPGVSGTPTITPPVLVIATATSVPPKTPPLLVTAAPLVITTPTSPRVGTPSPTVVMQVPTTTVTLVGKYPVFQLTTGLGISVTIEIAEFDTGNGVLNYLLGFTSRIPVKIDDGVYLLVPSRIFVRAEEREGLQIVTLANGQELRGRLDLSFFTPDKKQYDLRSARKVVLISLPQDQSSIERSKQKLTGLWQLHLTKPSERTYSISNPRFAFQYEVLSITGIYYQNQTESETFYLKVGNDEIPANLPDFEEIAFEPNGQVRVKPTGGIETVGALAVKVKRSQGYEQGYYWHLAMDLADSEMTLVLKNPVCTLHKVPN